MNADMVKAFMVSGANVLISKARTAIVSNGDWRSAVQALRDAADAAEACCQAIEKEIPEATQPVEEETPA